MMSTPSRYGVGWIGMSDFGQGRQSALDDLLAPNSAHVVMTTARVRTLSEWSGDNLGGVLMRGSASPRQRVICSRKTLHTRIETGETPSHCDCRVCQRRHEAWLRIWDNTGRSRRPLRPSAHSDRCDPLMVSWLRAPPAAKVELFMTRQRIRRLILS